MVNITKKEYEKLILRLNNLENENKKLKKQFVSENKNKKINKQKINTEYTYKKPKPKVLSEFEIRIIRHKRYLIAKDRRNKIIDKIKYNPKTVNRDKHFYKTHGNSFDENIYREDRTHVREVHIKTNSSNKGKTDSINKYNRKIKNKKYLYNITAKNKDGEIIQFNKDETGRQREAVASGRMINSYHNGHYITRDESKKEAYSNLFRIISAAFSNGSKSDAADGMQIVEEKGWVIEENIIYYENID
jgi:hypothetical protein